MKSLFPIEAFLPGPVRWSPPRRRCLSVRRPSASVAAPLPFRRATPRPYEASEASGPLMTENNKSSQTSNIARGRDDETSTTPALRHVGRTLESDPSYFANEIEGEGLTPDAQIANVGAPADT